MKLNGWPKWSGGVRPRLFVALFIPFALLIMATIQLSAEALRTSQRAADVDDIVTDLQPLVTLNAAVFDERLVVDATFRDDTDLLTGQTIAASLSLERMVTDRAIAALDEAPLDIDDLMRNREVQDRNRVATSFPGRYAALATDIDEAIRSDVLAAGSLVQTFDAPALQNAVDTTEAALDTSSAAFETVVGLRSYWTAAEFERAFIRSGLARSFGDFERAADEMDRLATGELLDQWSATSSDRAKLERVVDEVLAGSVPTPTDPIPLDAGLTQVPTSMVELTTAAAQDASHEAAEATVALRRAAAYQALVAALFLLASVFAVISLSGSILKPLRRLSEQARTAAQGNLVAGPLVTTGADEVQIATSAFNDLVQNIKLAERKVVALGEARLDAPVLREPLPGRMGASLQASFEALSEATVEQERLRKSLEHQATHDFLTSVLNRETAISRLDAIAAGTGSASVILLELRNFKAVNDTYGHRVGDDVLRQLAGRLQSILPTTATLARFGGDEFLVYQHEPPPGTPLSLARTLVSVVSAPFEAMGLTITISADAGLAEGDDGGRALLAGAIVAVAEANSESVGGVRVYDETLQRSQADRTKLEGWLIGALGSGGNHTKMAELHLEYQPLIGNNGRTVEAVEALLRMTDPDGNPVRTDQLIEVAERSALILQLGNWVLETVVGQLAEWAHDPLLSQLVVSVNASAVQLLDPDFASTVASTIERHGVSARSLVIELTETALITDAARASTTLRQLQAAGVSVALDDFGTGYTSIGQLRSLPIDKLKIDRSLINDVASSEDEQALIRVIVELAHQLHLSLVAEGVEDLDQFTLLSELGITTMQGWLFSRSLPSEQLRAFISGFEQPDVDHTAAVDQI